MQEVAGLQRAAGHDVAFFGMDHPDNDPQVYAEHFPGYLELEPAPASAVDKVTGFGRMVWSTSARSYPRREDENSTPVSSGRNVRPRAGRSSLFVPAALALSGSGASRNRLRGVARQAPGRHATGRGRRTTGSGGVAVDQGRRECRDALVLSGVGLLSCYLCANRDFATA